MNIETQVLEMLTQRGETVVWSTDAALRVTTVRGEAGLLKQLAGAMKSHRCALRGESSAVEVGVDDRTFDVRVEPLRADDGSIVGCIGMAHDVTACRAAERAALWQSAHDAVTGLPNRRQMRERLMLSVANARHHDAEVAVILVDVDAFRVVNAAAGQNAGDALLAGSAERLAQCAAPHLLARTGDNEFTIVAEGAGDAAVRQLSAAILAAFDAPFVVEGLEVHVTASIGVADLARDGDCTDAILRAATAALRRAKELGGNRRQHSSRALTAAELDRSHCDRRLRHAIRNEELSLVYQPQIRLRDGAVLGLEALLRWTREGRLVPAADFIGAVEHSPVIVTLGEWVMEETCRQINAWRDAGVTIPRVAVNIGARHFQQPGLLQTIRRALDRHHVAGTQIELEITETAAMHNADVTARMVDALRDLGLEITIDDFGTGYSSLAYLKRFAITGLKIDRSFVSDLPGSRSASAIVNAILATARALDLRVVAEGVETQEQAHFLSAAGCQEAQGYWFARPMAADAVPEYLHAKGGK